MSWGSFMLDLRWKLRYRLFRTVLPWVHYEPFTIQNLAHRAWPFIVALTSSHDYSSGIDSICESAENLHKTQRQMLPQHAVNSKPIVVRGYARDCPVSTWSMDNLRREFGDQQVSVKVGDYVSDFGQPRKALISIAEFADYLGGKVEFPHKALLVDKLAPYVGDEQIQELADMLPYPSLLSQENQEHGPIKDLTTFWLGSRNTKTPLHCHHFCDTFLLQLIGHRRVTLIPPHQALLIGYVPHTINIGTAAFDPFNPKPAQFPGLNQIHCIEIELAPGDGLLIPGFWFHAVHLSEPSLSASRFTRSSMPAALGGGSCDPWRKAASYSRGW